MTDALALYPTHDEFSAMMNQADVLFKSGLMPTSIKNPQAIVAIMMLGRELNIPTWQALTGVNVIQGKPSVGPQLMLALIERSGLQEDIQHEKEAGKSHTVTMKRKGRTAYTETFTMEMAKAMGLADRDQWKKQPAVMLKWRAISACARVVYPDVLMGIYLTEELAPDQVVIDADGEIRYAPTPAPVEIKVLPSQNAKRIIRDTPKSEQPDLVIVDGTLAVDTQPEAEPEKPAEQPVATWDTPDILNILLRKCQKQFADYMPDVQASDIMRWIGLPDREFGVMAHFTQKFATPRAAFEYIEDQAKFETLAQ